MNIGIVTHKLVRGDGQGRVNLEIAHQALRDGHTLTLLSSEIDDGLADQDAVTWVPIPVDGIPTTLLRDLVFSWRSSRWLRRHGSEIDALLSNGCITHYPSDINMAHFVHSAWAKSPANTARTDQGARALYHRLYTLLNARWEKPAFRAARVVVAVSDQVRRELIEDAGVEARDIEVIYNGVDLDEFKPGFVDRGRLGLPSEVPLCVFVGDLQTPRKNLDTVLRALQDVPDLHIAIVGDTTDSVYPAMAGHLGVSDRAHFLGFRRDVPALMRASDFCACPSRYEPFSLVALEAMASGLPVITSSRVGAAALIDDSCGVVIQDPEDASVLTRAFRMMSRDRDRLRSMAEAARERAEAHSWQHMSEQYLNLVGRVARHKREPSTAESPAL